jgi:hypothetical protein
MGGQSYRLTNSVEFDDHCAPLLSVSTRTGIVCASRRQREDLNDLAPNLHHPFQMPHGRLASAGESSTSTPARSRGSSSEELAVGFEPTT